MPSERVAHAILVSLTLLSLFLDLAVTWAFLQRWRGDRERASGPRGERHAVPLVSILKPLAGGDDELEENLRSFAGLTYPRYEVLFGVASLSDPAAEVARRVLCQHPNLNARLILTNSRSALNPKVAQLIPLARQARGSLYVISDSNVRVGPGYLEPIVRAFSDPKVGVVTNLFVGTGELTLGAAIENLQTTSVIAPQLGASTTLFPSAPLTVGKSMSLRKSVLRELGGFEEVSSVLAEDYRLGRLVAERGYRGVLLTDVVENRNTTCGLDRTIERHTRWSKMRRSISPVAFLFEPLLEPVAVAFAGALLTRTISAALLALGTLTLMSLRREMTMRFLRGRGMGLRVVPLELLRSGMIVLCWMRALISRSVCWRGNRFALGAGSTLRPIPPRHVPTFVEHPPPVIVESPAVRPTISRPRKITARRPGALRLQQQEGGH